MIKVETTEHGWPGHFICGTRCIFHRNTHIKYRDRIIVVSTVGNYHSDARQEKEMETIGCERHYETMAFAGDKENEYIEADVSKEIHFDNHWAIKLDEKNKDNIDNLADRMHNAVVNELSGKITGAKWWKEQTKERS